MSIDSQQLAQLLNGRWAGIMGDYACEIHFGTIGLADPKFSGQMVIKDSSIKNDKNNQAHKIVKLDKINLFDQFGNGYISFTFDSSTVIAMVSKKSLTLKGHRKFTAQLRHQHYTQPGIRQNDAQIHWYFQGNWPTTYAQPSLTITEPFFAQKMS